LKLSNEFKVGILAVFAIIILILGYQFLRSGQFFQQGRTFYVNYASISGLSETDNVMFKGYQLGKVQSIKLIEHDTGGVVINVGFTITEDFTVFEDTEARIVNSDLLGDKAIALIHHNKTRPAADGHTLKGTIEQTLSQQIEEELLPVKNKIELLVSNIDSVISRVQGIFDVDFQGKINENLLSIEGALKNIRSITENVEEIVAMEKHRVDTVMRNVQAITTTIKNNNEELDRTFKNLATLSDSLSQINYGQLFTKVDTVTERLDNVIAKVERGEGTLGELVHDEELYSNLKKISVSLNQLINDIQENPGRYSPTLFRIGTK
jgi:phospholipid/cholesterol/gamma-HCH transport system substrate-binding protein